eukprot:gnl/TRDRNA2_/TRDRNA2_205299_c0_seq1.p1 gnl/TRDRNA2_/TRDRNA2_205299_c0~~gnl/TRDRNA2_/TRDRNA2_205299_c0_seq1.p1  ORF type:complete len:184 (+),score=12.29 gnl/TRDRNA2_/TRDRNA2_205299_c0_seq1:186-737(+)
MLVKAQSTTGHNYHDISAATLKLSRASFDSGPDANSKSGRSTNDDDLATVSSATESTRPSTGELPSMAAARSGSRISMPSNRCSWEASTAASRLKSCHQSASYGPPPLNERSSSMPSIRSGRSMIQRSSSSTCVPYQKPNLFNYGGECTLAGLGLCYPTIRDAGVDHRRARWCDASVGLARRA